MNRSDAIRALSEGKILTHKSFKDDKTHIRQSRERDCYEWSNGELVTKIDFWSDSRAFIFDDNWSEAK
jgi:hypothetical protein